jgi:hypothetical protein
MNMLCISTPGAYLMIMTGKIDVAGGLKRNGID